MITALDPADRADWNQELLSMPGHSFFHSSTWSDVLKESYRYRPFYFADCVKGEVKSVLPVMGVESLITGKRGVSLPFSDYCEPLADDAQSFRVLLAAAIEHGRREHWKYLEIRGGQRFLEGEDEEAAYLGHVIDLTNGALDSELRDSNRRNIRKAEKEGVEVEITTAPEALTDFYRLNCLTRKEHGIPPQPLAFFQAFFERVICGTSGFVARAVFDGRTIASNVYILFGGKAIYKYGASDRQYNHLRANNLLMWKAIEFCSEIGMESLCLGRTDFDHHGLRQFKAGWNAREYTIKYYRYSFGESKFVKGSNPVPGFAHKLFRKLPSPILNAAGSLLYRHIG